ncbi:MAG: protein-methionine-sulfoxide reductase catalytic subunit MsrP [Pikeienuella sp.]
MIVIRRPEWSLPESAATSENVYLNRRALLAGMGIGAIALASPARAASPYELATNPDYSDAGRPVTPERLSGAYNNFMEFGSHKQIAAAAESLDTEEWTLTVDGLVEKEMTFSTDDLIAAFGLEERIYRHRCVEAWSMVAPWIGFPLEKLVRHVSPLSSAKYVRFETFLNPEEAHGQQQSWYPWPYVEGLTMAEAVNPLPMLVLGAYGKVMAKQFGAPVRLHAPWKYGFKSIKSIARISFVEERPVSFWEELQESEYGFWANVNPEVAHPRWSQATERDLETGAMLPTQIFNGYGETVAALYAGDPAAQQAGERLWR